MRPAPSLGHRPELDGLRGVAVLAVAVFHTHLRLARGGWLGVDVFFVLSGFLITTLLLEERERTGRVDLRSFYVRRGLRLLPALGVLLAFLGLLVAIGAARPSTLGGAPWVLVYVANWAFAFGEEISPLTHLWSLAVEEQFYVVWPPLLLALVARVRGARGQAGVLAVAIAAVVALRVTLSLTGAITERHAYFGTDVRCDALLLGCFLAIARRAGWTEAAARHLQRLLWPAVVVLGAICLSPLDPFGPIAPLAFAVVDVAAFVVIAALVTNPGAVAILRWRPLVRLGVLSYGIYLWHVPVMFVFDMAPMTRFVLGIPLAIVIAEVSHRLVEAPALRWKRSPVGPTLLRNDHGVEVQVL